MLITRYWTLSLTQSIYADNSVFPYLHL